MLLLPIADSVPFPAVVPRSWDCRISLRMPILPWSRRYCICSHSLSPVWRCVARSQRRTSGRFRPAAWKLPMRSSTFLRVSVFFGGSSLFSFAWCHAISTADSGSWCLRNGKRPLQWKSRGGHGVSMKAIANRPASVNECPGYLAESKTMHCVGPVPSRRMDASASASSRVWPSQEIRSMAPW